MKQNSKIWLSSPHMSGEEISYIKDAFDTNWIAPLGPHVDQFEQEISTYVSINDTAVLSSGTAAIHLALILLGVGKGDEVLVQCLTFSATVNPIRYVGATPILIDSEIDTWNMCPQALEYAINDRLAKTGKKPKAIIPVHLYGMPAQMDKICRIAADYKIPIIEDSAEALGSSLKGKRMGAWGQLGVLSFNGNKIITTSSGGALLSDDVALIDRARFLSTQARDNAPHYQHSEIGYNYRMSNVLAAIGRAQLKVLNKRIEEHRRVNNWYKKIFEAIEGIAFQEELTSDFYSNFWLTAITVDSNKAGGITADGLRRILAKNNIESRPIWKPMHLQPIYSECEFYETGVAQRLFEKGICLPSGSNMSIEDFHRIEAVLTKVLKVS